MKSYFIFILLWLYFAPVSYSQEISFDNIEGREMRIQHSSVQSSYVETWQASGSIKFDNDLMQKFCGFREQRTFCLANCNHAMETLQTGEEHQTLKPGSSSRP